MAEFDAPARRRAGTDKLGYCTLAVSRVMAYDLATLRTVLAAEFSRGPPTDGFAAARQARAGLLRILLIAAGMAASTRATEEAKASVGHRAIRRPLVLPRGPAVSLRIESGSQSGCVPDNIGPCAALIEERFEESDDGSLAVALLAETVSAGLARD